MAGTAASSQALQERGSPLRSSSPARLAASQQKGVRQTCHAMCFLSPSTTECFLKAPSWHIMLCQVFQSDGWIGRVILDGAAVIYNPVAAR